jgi:hypothetical protein
VSELEASLINTKSDILDIKIFDNVVHHFTITILDTKYEITDRQGQVIAIADATSDIDIVDVDSINVKIKTRSHIFEIVQADNYCYWAHKQLIK